MSEKKRNRPHRLRVVSHYSGGDECCCFCGSKENLNIDHINGGGYAHKKKITKDGKKPGSLRDHLHAEYLKLGVWPEGYRVLCRLCNFMALGSKHPNITRLHQSVSSGLYKDIIRLRTHYYQVPDAATNDQVVEVK